MVRITAGGYSVTYEKMNSARDRDIPALLAAYRSPETARFISLDEENYWRYVTTADGVSFFKAFERGMLVAAVHCELQERTMYMDIMVLPQWRRCGIGTKVMQDVLQGVLIPDFDQIEVSIDEANTASIRLFEKMGFLFMSQTDELRNYLYRRA